MASCSRDLDCANNMVCAVNATWFDAQVHSECMCSTYYGFSNPQDGCAGVLETATSQFWVATAVLLLLLSSGLTASAAWEVGRLAKNKLFARDAQTVGTVQIFLCALCMLANQAGTMATALMPQNAHRTLTPDDVNADKANSHHVAWVAFLCISAVFALTGAITIAVMWIEVANRVAKMQANSRHRGGFFAGFRNVVALDLVLTLGMLVPMCAGQPTYALLVAFCIQTGTLALYTYGNIKITRVVREMETTSSRNGPSPQANSGTSDHQRNKEYRRVLRRMHTSTMLIATFVLVACAFSILLLVTTVSGWKEYAPPGQVSVPIVAIQFMALAILCTGYEVVRFLRESTSRKIARAREVTTTVMATHGGATHNRAAGGGGGQSKEEAVSQLVVSSPPPPT